MFKCKCCGHELPVETLVCPHCGSEVDFPEELFAKPIPDVVEYELCKDSEVLKLRSAEFKKRNACYHLIVYIEVIIAILAIVCIETTPELAYAVGIPAIIVTVFLSIMALVFGSCYCPKCEKLINRYYKGFVMPVHCPNCGFKLP